MLILGFKKLRQVSLLAVPESAARSVETEIHAAPAKIERRVLGNSWPTLSFNK